MPKAQATRQQAQSSPSAIRQAEPFAQVAVSASVQSTSSSATRTYAQIAQVSSIHITQSTAFNMPFDPLANFKEEIELSNEDVLLGRSL